MDRWGRRARQVAWQPDRAADDDRRRSDQPRTNAIWAYPDGDALVLVGSYGGRRTTPGWVYNLRAQPEAIVLVRREVRRVRAREALGEEYARLWKMVVERDG